MAKSWDIQPAKKPSIGAQPLRAPQQPSRPRVEPMRRAPTPARRIPEPRVAVTRRDAARRVSTPAPRVPLRKRRRTKRTRLFTIITIVIVLLLGLGEYALWQPWLRVTHVTVNGPDAEQMQAFAQSDLAGTRFLVVPKSSIFFLPTTKLRSDILAHFPDVEAVAIAPSSLDTLTLAPIARATAFWWCGPMLAMPEPSCYEADSTGVIFAEVATTTASTSMLSLYAPLAPTDGANLSPLGRTLSGPSFIPPLLEFVKTLATLGANVTVINTRTDEADLYTTSNTRITYVLGREQQAAQLAASAFPQLKLNDGSLLYVDLRFPDKVYFKRTNDKSSTPTTL